MLRVNLAQLWLSVKSGIITFSSLGKESVGLTFPSVIKLYC